MCRIAGIIIGIWLRALIGLLMLAAGSLSMIYPYIPPHRNQ